MSRKIKPSPTDNKQNVTEAIDTQSRMLMIVVRRAGRAQIYKFTRGCIYTERAFLAQVTTFRE